MTSSNSNTDTPRLGVHSDSVGLVRMQAGGWWLTRAAIAPRLALRPGDWS